MFFLDIFLFANNSNLKLKQAEKLMKKKAYSEAAPLLEDTIQNNNNENEIIKSKYLLLFCNYHIKEYKKVIAQSEIFINKNQQHYNTKKTNVFMLILHSYYSLKEYKKYCESYQRFILNYPKYKEKKELLVMLGYSYYRLDEHNNALDTYNLLLTKYPKYRKDKYVKDVLYSIYRKQGNNEKAEKILNNYYRMKRKNQEFSLFGSNIIGLVIICFIYLYNLKYKKRNIFKLSIYYALAMILFCIYFCINFITLLLRYSINTPLLKRIVFINCILTGLVLSFIIIGFIKNLKR